MICTKILCNLGKTLEIFEKAVTIKKWVEEIQQDIPGHTVYWLSENVKSMATEDQDHITKLVS